MWWWVEVVCGLSRFCFELEGDKSRCWLDVRRNAWLMERDRWKIADNFGCCSSLT